MDDNRSESRQDVRLHEDFFNTGADEGTCPECGMPLDQIPDVEKHSIAHYGDEPIRVTPTTKLARQRQAKLLGQPIPER